MDGPAHLYNSNILVQLLAGNNVMSSFYIINNTPIPNWTSHIILLIFNSFLPAWLAEKFFLVIYISGMAVSFRYLVKTLNPNNISLSIIIFPFIYSFLFHLGFYNFSLSIILLFTTLGFWLRHHHTTKLSFYLVLIMLITTTYFTNLLVFGILGLTIGIYILYFSIKDYFSGKLLIETLTNGARKLLVLFLVSLPGLILLFVFFKNVHFSSTDQAYSSNELIKWINDARPFIIYNYQGEEVITEQFFHILLLLLALSFISISKENKRFSVFNDADILAFPLALTLTLLFITPNGSGAGMMSDRYILLFYMFLLLWVVSRTRNKKLNRLAITIFISLHLVLLNKHYSSTLTSLDSRANEIVKASENIERNSIVLPINFSDNWIEPHFSNYLGIDKPIIVLENYEASVGWFPIKWNLKNMPSLHLGNKNEISGLHWPNNTKSTIEKQIDYVLIYGNQNKIDNPKWSQLQDLLKNNYSVIYKSESNYVLLYMKNN
jgi:hypothetical protein